MSDPSPPWPGEGVRRFGAINGLGLWTLYVKEVKRFIKVSAQTIVAPMITTLLFLAIFALALGDSRPSAQGVPFTEFLAPGLIMMAIMQNAFTNTSSSLLISKIQGNIVDVLMPPLSPGELNAGFALGGMTRGVVIAIVTAIGMLPFVSLQVAHGWAVIYFAVGAALMLGQIGILAGIWSYKFDHIQSITNFVIMPLSFLSGTFYEVAQLPPLAHQFTRFNPFFYMIDGFRYGFTGIAEGSIVTGVILIAVIDVALWLLCYQAFRRGWRLKT